MCVPVLHTRIAYLPYRYARVNMLETYMRYMYAGLNLFQLGDMYAEHVSS